MRPFAASLLLVFLLEGAVPAVAGPPGKETLDELGMPPRPTLECGGADAMHTWDLERLSRRTSRAREALSRFGHDLGDRLHARWPDAVEDIADALRRDFEACLDREPPRDRVCVAAALGRADFCAWPEHPAREKACRVVVAAAAAIRAADPLVCAGVGAPFLRRLCERAVRGEPDRRIHCPPEDPACPILTAVSLSACRSWWWAASSFPMGRALCAWTEILEALRRDPARGCAGVPDALRPLCAAVAAQDPEACPPPISTSVPPVVLSGRCRNAVVPGRDLDAMQAPYGNGLILSFPLRNAFERAATCRVTAALSAGGRVLVRGTSEPVALPASGGPRPSMLSILRFRMAPAPAGLDLSWDVDCSWPHEEGFLRPRRDGVRVVH